MNNPMKFICSELIEIASLHKHYGKPGKCAVSVENEEEKRAEQLQ